jgi:AraC family transcriptional regulator of adaptative response/methylated-DNA-[protein]-cysteine methyltransferase
LIRSQLPSEEVMYDALLNRDGRFEGIFFFAVKTTGVFCRPTCSARRPRPENVEFFPSPEDAINSGYRPCRVCRPMERAGQAPDWINALLDLIGADPGLRLKDADIRAMEIDPARVRRWFQKHHGMSFHAYARALRINNAFSRVKGEEKVITAAMELGFDSLSGFNHAFRRTTGCSPRGSWGSAIITVARLLTPLGPMLGGASEEGICLLEFADRGRLEKQLICLAKRMNGRFVRGKSPLIDRLQEQLDDYFNGRRREFDIPLVMPGTPFRQQIWRKLQEIPYGETLSYRELADAVGKLNAARAVAQANGDNRLAMLVPCHRVIAADGGLAGYGGGVWRKRYLIDLERAQSARC